MLLSPNLLHHLLALALLVCLRSELALEALNTALYQLNVVSELQNIIRRALAGTRIARRRNLLDNNGALSHLFLKCLKLHRLLLVK